MKKMLAVLLALAVTKAGAFTFDDIHFWVGEGTNRTAVVVDWTYMGWGTKTWGYRWNGENKKSLFKIMKEIQKEDHRFTFAYSVSQWGPFIEFIGYDEKDSGPVWDYANGTSTDPESWFGLGDSVSYVYSWRIYGGPTGDATPAKGEITLKGETFPTTPQYQSSKGASGLIPKPNEWYVLTLGETTWEGDWNTGHENPLTLETPVAAASPYGWRVAEKDLSVHNPIFADPNNVLGRPSTMNQDRPGSGQEGGLGIFNSPGPVSPAHPACDYHSILSIENKSFTEAPFVVIEFDHQVVDDEKNPYGLDFIVFGNAFAAKKNADHLVGPASDPRNIRFTGEGIAEKGIVSVSQDGKTWFTFDQPFADDLYPTLGYVIDRKNPNKDLFEGNLYWGEKTDATIPVDPSIKWSDFANYNLEEIVNIYGKSAGGAGFDISQFNLTPNADGKKWIKFVKIAATEFNYEGDVGWTQPEVDAVSDVRPVDGYTRWAIQNYTWKNRWDSMIAGRDAVGPNGKQNAVSYLMGYAATETCPLDFKVSKFIPGENFHVLEFKTKNPVTAGMGVFVDFFQNLGEKASRRELPYYEDGYRTDDGFFVNRARVANPIMGDPDKKQLFMKLVFPE